jgi:membrane-associated phospholipid phosphatase
MFASVHLGYRLTIALLLLLTAVLLAFPALDRWLFDALNVDLGPTGEIVWANLTNLGDGLVATVFGIALFARSPRLLLLVFLSVIVVGLLANLGKELFNTLTLFETLQLRPFGRLGLECGNGIVEDCVYVTGKALKHYSFPSGHAAAAATVATLFCLKISSLPWRVLVVIVFSLSALSRVAVGAHWPVDVSCGAMLGVIGTLFCAWLSDRFISNPGEKAQFGLLLFAMAVSIALYFNAQDYEAIPGVNLVENSMATIALLICVYQLVQLNRRRTTES